MSRTQATRTVVYLGFTDSAIGESAAVAKAVQRRTEAGTAESIVDRPDLDVAKTVDELQISAEKRQLLKALLAKVSPSSRDEVVGLAKMFGEAEAGKRVLDRLIISGHGVWDLSDEISGFSGIGGSINYSNLEQLTALFPDAAKQLKHLVLSACATSHEPVFAFFSRIFPNLQTAKGYWRGPSYGPAEDDLTAFVAATASALKPPSVVAASLATGNATVWQRGSQRLLGGPWAYTSVPSTVLEARCTQLWPSYEAYVSGKNQGSAHDDPDMISLQYILMTLTGRKDLTDERRYLVNSNYEGVRKLRLGF